MYSTSPALLFEFTSSYNIAGMQAAVSQIPLSPTTQSYPHIALDFATNHIFTSSQLGYRGGAAAVIMVMGKHSDSSSRQMLDSGAALRALGVDVFVVSVGAPNTAAAEAIAAEPFASHLYALSNYGELAGVIPNVAHNVFCFAGTRPAPIPTATATPVPTTAFSTTPPAVTTPRITTIAATTVAPATTAAPAFQITNCTNGQTSSGAACSCTDSLCDTCQVTAVGSTCIKCSSNMILFRGACIGTCPSGYALTQSSSTGLSCSALCQFSQTDVVILIDSSSSISPTQYTDILRFAGNVVSNLPTDDDTVRVAVINFAEGAEVELMFRDQYLVQSTDVQDIIRLSSYQGGLTSIANGLKAAKHLFQGVGTGYRGGKGSVVLFSDGQGCQDAVTVSGSLHAAGIDVVTVGFGQEIDSSELSAIASSSAASFKIPPGAIADDLSALAFQVAQYVSCATHPVQPASIVCSGGVSQTTGLACSCNAACSSCLISPLGVQSCLHLTECPSQPFAPFDVVFLIDDSNDMGAYKFPFVLQLVQNLVSALPVGVNDVHVAAMSYADDTLLNFNFKQYTSSNDVNTGVSGIEFSGGPANLAQALDSVRTSLVWSTSNGFRGTSMKVVIIGDGPVLADTRQAAANLKVETGIELFGVGVGSGNVSSLAELLFKSENLFVPSSIELLREPGFAHIIARALTCPTVVPPPTDSPLLNPTDSPTSGSGSGSGSGEAMPSVTGAPAPSQQSTGSSGAADSSASSGVPTVFVAVVASVGSVALVAAVAVYAVRRSNATPTAPPRNRLTKKKLSDMSFDLTWENEFMGNPPPGFEGTVTGAAGGANIVQRGGHSTL